MISIQLRDEFGASEKINCEKEKLISFSPYFGSLFGGQFSEANKESIELFVPSCSCFLDILNDKLFHFCLSDLNIKREVTDNHIRTLDFLGLSIDFYSDNLIVPSSSIESYEKLLHLFEASILSPNVYRVLFRCLPVNYPLSSFSLPFLEEMKKVTSSIIITQYDKRTGILIQYDSSNGVEIRRKRIPPFSSICSSEHGMFINSRDSSMNTTMILNKNEQIEQEVFCCPGYNYWDYEGPIVSLSCNHELNGILSVSDFVISSESCLYLFCFSSDLHLGVIIDLRERYIVHRFEEDVNLCYPYEDDFILIIQPNQAYLPSLIYLNSKERTMNYFEFSDIFSEFTHSIISDDRQTISVCNDTRIVQWNIDSLNIVNEYSVLGEDMKGDKEDKEESLSFYQNKVLFSASMKTIKIRLTDMYTRKLEYITDEDEGFESSIYKDLFDNPDDILSYLSGTYDLKKPNCIEKEVLDQNFNNKRWKVRSSSLVVHKYNVLDRYEERYFIHSNANEITIFTYNYLTYEPMKVYYSNNHRSFHLLLGIILFEYKENFIAVRCSTDRNHISSIPRVKNCSLISHIQNSSRL